MRRYFICFCLLGMGYLGFGQTYSADWASLDARPVAPWFEDAKFGIFIHWGPYSVPAWSPKGTYSEWYQFWLQEKRLFGNGDFKGDEVARYHEITYPGKDYYNFGAEFKADLFQPEAWAGLFEDSGARYVVLTSKHHDGYTLWPSKEANDRGFPWNSMEVGSKRDLVGELSSAVKSRGLKMGLYYSLYEWYHPWWINDKPRFVKEHYLPQIKDLVQNYKPDILWADGEWELPAKDWQSPEFLAWLFNESEVAQSVVINDRWGKGDRHKHGGYYTTEYESGAENQTHPWEECRGMGFSFGYNRNEDAIDYNSPRALVLMLLNVVSAGGNLLLDIGPDGRGQIPPIMQERLLQMGTWLQIYGEGIYGTRPWIRSYQWSEGSREFKSESHYLGGDFILQQTLFPKKGQAVKELFFTQNNEALFAFFPKWPGKTLLIKDFIPDDGASIKLLTTEKRLDYRVINGNTEILLPESVPQTPGFEAHYTYGVKITKNKS